MSNFWTVDSKLAIAQRSVSVPSELDHGISRPNRTTDDYNAYSKNDFLTFVRESIKEASTCSLNYRGLNRDSSRVLFK